MGAIFDQEDTVLLSDGFHLANRTRETYEVREMKRCGLRGNLSFDVVQVHFHAASDAVKAQSRPRIHKCFDFNAVVIRRHQNFAAFESQQFHELP